LNIHFLDRDSVSAPACQSSSTGSQAHRANAPCDCREKAAVGRRGIPWLAVKGGMI